MGNTNNYYSHHNFHIKPNYIVSIPIYESTQPKLRSKLQYENEQNLKNNSTNGLISKKADKKIRNAVNWLFVSAKNKRVYDKKSKKSFYFKLNFITLTLPSTNHNITDNEFKNNLLKKFIFNCKYSYGLKNYIWKVEAQENGNIHAHFTTDTFIHHQDIRKTWNKILSKNKIMDEFENKFGHRNPNSTDVKTVKNIKNLQSYICKYLAKNDTNRRKITGRLWGSNYNISEAQKLKTEIQIHNHSEVEKFINNPKLEYKNITTKPDINGNSMSLGTIYFMNEFTWSNAPNQLKEVYNDTRYQIRKGTSYVNFSKASELKKYEYIT